MLKEQYHSVFVQNFFNHLSPTIHIQILLTHLHTVSYSVNWENLFKDQSKFLLVIRLLILVTFSVDYVLIW